MPEHSDTTAYPAFTGATAKRDLIRYILGEIEPSCPTALDVVFRLNNTDLSALTDGATVYDPVDTFASA